MEGGVSTHAGWGHRARGEGALHKEWEAHECARSQSSQRGRSVHGVDLGSPGARGVRRAGAQVVVRIAIGGVCEDPVPA